MGGGMRRRQTGAWPLFGSICVLCVLCVGGDWCRNEEFDVGIHTFCVDPSIGPDTGGTPVVLRGFTKVFYPDWPTQCSQPARFGCVFGDTAAVQPATRVSCETGHVECRAPSNDSPSDPESRLPFDVIVQVVVNRGTYTDVLPPPGYKTVYFAYFDVSFLTPIGGAWGLRPSMEIAMLNTKNEETFWCRFIPFCRSGVGTCGWDYAAMNHQTRISLMQREDGVMTKNSYTIPPDDVAGYLRSGRVRCGVQDALFILKPSATFAQMWIEIAIDRSDGILTFSQNERIFTLYRPPNVTSVSISSGPYTGQTDVIFYGEGFFSFLGLACRLLWCLDYTNDITCQPAEFEPKPMSLDKTAVKCTTSEYYPNDQDCRLCLAGGRLAGYRAVRAETDTEFRSTLQIDCCGDSCCAERSRVQLSLDGDKYIPTFDSGTASPYILIANAPKVFYTMYQPPIMMDITPAAGPLKGSGIVTISGLNMFSASLNVSSGKVFCRFSVYNTSSPTLLKVSVPARYVSDKEVTCVAPPSDRHAGNVLGLTLNSQNFHEEAAIRFAYFAPLRAEPPFGGWFGATIVRVVGFNMNAMEGVGKIPAYKCKFVSANRTTIVPGVYSPPDAVACSAPEADKGFAQIKVALVADVFSDDDIPFEFVEEAFVFTANPVMGPLTGGFIVQLTGANFKNSTFLRCRFGDELSPALYVSPTVIDCIAPTSTVLGMVRVYALNNGQQLSATDTHFTYFDVVSVVPDGGPVEGGTDVLVRISTATEKGWCRFGTSVVQARVIVDPLNLTQPSVAPPLRFRCFNVSANSSFSAVSFVVSGVNVTVQDGGNGTFLNSSVLNASVVNGTLQNISVVDCSVFLSSHSSDVGGGGGNSSSSNSSSSNSSNSSDFNSSDFNSSSSSNSSSISSNSSSSSSNSSSDGNSSSNISNISAYENCLRLAGSTVNSSQSNTSTTSLVSTLTSLLGNASNASGNGSIFGICDEAAIQQAFDLLSAMDALLEVFGSLGTGGAVSNLTSVVAAMLEEACLHCVVLPPAPDPPGRFLVCRTLQGMSTFDGQELPFGVSINDRDYAVAAEFVNFTFYPRPRAVRLLPESGPMRGSTGVTIIGSNFFTLCKTGTNEITGMCYRCDAEGPSTFRWTEESSCKVTIAGMAPHPCGLPCHPGKDDRDAFGESGAIYCGFGEMKVTARYMTQNRIKCFSPRTPDPSVAVRLLTGVSANDQQYSEETLLFSYYSLSSLSPSSGPTFGDTIVSVYGNNLFTGARDGTEVQCMFWLDIVQLGRYDVDNDVVLCPVPEQPAELKDARIDTIEFSVTLNYRIPEQYTDNKLVFEYIQDAIATEMYPAKGPMNGGFVLYLKLPPKLVQTPDLLHQDFPYNPDQHYFALEFVNDTLAADRRSVCFGGVTTFKNTQLVVPQTCCDNIATEATCDGVVAPAQFVNSSFLRVIVPPYPSPDTINIELAGNGVTTGNGVTKYNPSAQITRQAYCDKDYNKCLQVNEGSLCITDLDCGGLVLRLWGIFSVFPTSYDIMGNVNIALMGKNFLHPEDQISRCYWFVDGVTAALGTEYASTATFSRDADCDECPARDENDLCVIERFCSVIRCRVPPAPAPIGQAVTVELYFGPSYPLTQQQTNVFYFASAEVNTLSVSAGPESGNTVVTISGSGFVPSPDLLCQFGKPAGFDFGLLYAHAVFIDTETISCRTPTCDLSKVNAVDRLNCSTCAYCNLQIHVTMNQRDFVNGAPYVWYRKVPTPVSIRPNRAPAASPITNLVTISGYNFSDPGSGPGGLSCKFGASIVPAHVPPECRGLNKQIEGKNCSIFNTSCTLAFCSTIFCTPPANPDSIYVDVFVSVDGQQFYPLTSATALLKQFAYYRVLSLAPAYVLGRGGATLQLTGINLDRGADYACKFTGANDTVAYAAALPASATTMRCSVPSLLIGRYNASASLDDASIAAEHRDYTAGLVSFVTFAEAHVTHLKPTRGKAAGGVRVTVTGTGFWASPLLRCAFGGVVAPTAVFVDNTTILCTSPARNGTVAVEVSFNAQEFSNSSVVFNCYGIPTVSSLTPHQLPALSSQMVLVRATALEDFETLACWFTSTLPATRWQRFSAPAVYINRTALMCQLPPSEENTIVRVQISLDAVQVSGNSRDMSYYDVRGVVPIVAQIEGATVMDVGGFHLSGGDAKPECLFAAQPGLDLVNTTNNAIYAIYVDQGGLGYSDGVYPVQMTRCVEAEEVVYGILVDNIAEGFFNGLYSLQVGCVAPCTGTGLSATYLVRGEVVNSATVLESGSGYTSAHPPTVSVWGCDGIGGDGVCGAVNFTVLIGSNCAGNTTGCCSQTLNANYSVFNGSVASVALIDYSSQGFNHLFPPSVEPNNCDGKGGGAGCQTCQSGRYISAGTCAGNGTCACSGFKAYCSDDGVPVAGVAVSCTCSIPNDGASCTADANCTGSGKCRQAATLCAIAANVTRLPGRYGPDGTSVMCDSPAITYPDSVIDFVTVQSSSKTYTGMALAYLKIKVHSGTEFSPKSVIFRYAAAPTVSGVFPNSASARGGSMVSVIGSGFRVENFLTTIRYPSGSEDTLVSMSVVCRLHTSLPSQPVVVINTTLLLCNTNRVCFDGSTMSGCQECIVEGCAQPTLSYSHSLPTVTAFSPRVSLNDQNFAGTTPFFVYSITAFRPFGGLYNGGTHVTIAGVGFDRGGAGPYAAHCRFSRILVPAIYDPLLQVVKCLSQPLLDVLTVLEVHLGADLEDDSLFTDNAHIFHYYTAFPSGLEVYPDSGSFSGDRPVSLSVPKPLQFNHFRFRSFDFNTNYQGVTTKVLVEGTSMFNPYADLKIGEFREIMYQELLVRRGQTLLGNRDVVIEARRALNLTNFELIFRVEPAEYPGVVAGHIHDLLTSGRINAELVRFGVSTEATPFVMTLMHGPETFSFYSQFAAFARFGPLVTTGEIYNSTTLSALIARTPVESASTVQVSFNINGQQFSALPLNFFYYTVAWVSPFGIPVNFGITANVEDTLQLRVCPEETGFLCSQTKVPTNDQFATIRVYGNNFRQEIVQVDSPTYTTAMCKYGDLADNGPGLIGAQLTAVEIEPALRVNFAEGWVECRQPVFGFDLNYIYDESSKARRIRLEVALNGRDFSFSALDEWGESGLVLFQEPTVIRYEPNVGPISGGTSVTVVGTGFRSEASTWRVPSCFCLFSTETSIAGNPAWVKVKGTVTSENTIVCVAPPFSANSYGYAAATFRPPPVDIPLFVSLNGHHWHAGEQRFSFFDILRISPTLSQNEFPAGGGTDAARDMTIEVGSFSNPGGYKIFCWWRVPGFGVLGGFVVEGSQINQGVYVCRIPDWKAQVPASVSLLPCWPPGPMTDGAVCGLDGSITVKLGVAFSPVSSTSLTPLDFSFSKTYTFYAKPEFFDFLPKIGDQLGGTEVHVYGKNFLDLPTLQCKFGDSAPNIYPATEVIFKSPELVICVSPRKALLAVLPFSITLNNVHWMKCNASSACFHDHPYKGGQNMACCVWEEQVSLVKTQLTLFTWAKRPSISILQPDAAPTQGDTDLKIIGNSLTPGSLGMTFACRIDGIIITGVSKSDGGVQILTCLTKPNMRAGELNVEVSVNEFEWSNTNMLTTYLPLRAFRVNPSFVVWDNPWFSVTIVGMNFKQADAGVGQIIVRLAEFSEDGIVRWKKDMSPVKYGNTMNDVNEPSLEGTTETDILTITPPKRSPCTQTGARYCEIGVIKVFVSQNEANDWTWENVELIYISRPITRTACYGGTADGKCGVEGVLVALTTTSWGLSFLDQARNKRGSCETGGTDATGQAMTTGNCSCTAADCRYYDCGNFDGKVALGCSVKAAITNVHPRSGPQAGGTKVSIRGAKFNAAAGFPGNYWCKFGTQSIQATFDAASGLIECYSPPLQKNGSVEMEVSISNEGEWTVSHGYHTFHYYYPPTVMGLEPSIGPATGYTTVSVTGGFTDKLMALGTKYRKLATDSYGAATCSGGDTSTGLCNGMYVFGAYQDFGPITPGREHICVVSEHCRYQLYQQHDLACEFSIYLGTPEEVMIYSVGALYILPNVLECTTPPYIAMLNRTSGPAYEDLAVRLTLNGQLWHESPTMFRYHAFNNITELLPEMGPAIGGTWITLKGTGFINSHLTVCMFGTKEARGYNYISESLVKCFSPPSDVLQSVPVQISFNGRQFAEALPRFEYVADWTIVRVAPQISHELGGSLVRVKGNFFRDASALACKFGDMVVAREESTDADGVVTVEGAIYVSETEMLCRVPRNIITRPRFVGDEASCDGTLVEGSSREDFLGWTVCAACTDCCKCPNCPECYPNCICPDAALAPGIPCCDTPSGGRLVSNCPPTPPLPPGAPRALCLPPQYDCRFVSTDETTKVLDCTLLPFAGTVYMPPQGTTLYVPPGDFLHPDLALRLTVPFYVSLDSQSWFSGCATNPRSDDPLNELPTERKCPTADDSAVERWYGTFTFIEVYNATRFKPSVAPVGGNTMITIYGEGFVETVDIRCKFGFVSDGTFDPDNPEDVAGELTGVTPNTVSGTFIDSFSVKCMSPELDKGVYGFGVGANINYVLVPLQVSINGLETEYTSDTNPFVYSSQWVISSIFPRNSPSIGGTTITFFGPYFHDSTSLMCKFGNLFATKVQRVSAQQVLCRAPSVNIHQRINVSITVDGSTWSVPSNATEMEYFGVRNLMLFGENEYGQLGFSKVGPRMFSGSMCAGGLYSRFDCTVDADCPAGICLEQNKDLNYEPVFLRELFARNVTGISMGQTHTMIIASETYSDEWGSVPRRGLVYIWGDNLVGQLGFGFAGDSKFEYNFSKPAPLVCSPEEIYLLDRRIDGQGVVGIPSNWPEGEWIVPACNITQDVLSEGKWLQQRIAVYNPFYYEQVVTVASGSFHSLAITESLDLYSWGWNNDGQLGMGPLELRPNIPYPTKVVYFDSKVKVKIVKISAGFAHTAAVTADGELYTWGNNRYGQLGLGDYVARRFPSLVTGFIDSRGAEFKVADVKCGLYHCLVQTTAGSIWSFGSNSRGQLGTCKFAPFATDNLDLDCIPEPAQDKEVVYKRNYPKKIDFMKITDYAGSLVGQPYITKFAAGAFHSLAVASPCFTPIKSMDDACPAFDFEAGDLYVWGNNKYGQLGTGSNADTKYEAVPKLITMLNTISTRCRFGETVDCVQSDDYFRIGKIVKDVAAGSWHSLVSLNQREDIGYRRSSYQVNRMFTMGNNDEGQLGHSDTTLRDIPTQIESNFVRFHHLGGNYYQSLFTLGCPPDDGNVCDGAGFCREQGVCDCYAGYRGQDCSIECDGGATTPCSGHGSPANALTIAKWRQAVILAASGHNLRRRLDDALRGWYCPGGATAAARAPSRNYAACTAACAATGASAVCVEIRLGSMTSVHLVALLDKLVTDHPNMGTAVNFVKDDWVIHMYVDGKKGKHSFPHQARQERLSGSTVGPDAGVWNEASVVPVFHMLQNRSTCWRSFSCYYGDCEATLGYARLNPGASRLDVNPGCIDGWTGAKIFKASLEQIDQAWSNLEIENKHCDPLFVANQIGIMKEQVQYIWASLEIDPLNITRSMQLLAYPENLLYPIADPVATVLRVRQAFDIDCQNFSIAQTLGGCMADGTCVCNTGWTGIRCDVECRGGWENPCSGHGQCRNDGACECTRGWTGRECDVECSGAASTPGHWPCNSRGMCSGWFVDPRTQHYYGPVEDAEEKYYSIGRQATFFTIGTEDAVHGNCDCHYGYRSSPDVENCNLQCPGTPLKYLDELGECFDNGNCTEVGICDCKDGFRNESCDVRCKGGHLDDILTGFAYSNECTSNFICDVYPNYLIQSITGPQFCKDGPPRDSTEYSRDYSVNLLNPAQAAQGVVLRVHNGLCQYETRTPPLATRQLPVPSCPGPDWCNATMLVAGPGGACSAPGVDHCVEHITRTKNYTGQPYTSTVYKFDPELGIPPEGCPLRECGNLAQVIKDNNYPSDHFGWHEARADTAPHHSAKMGNCYCLEGFRGAACNKKCPGAVYSSVNPAGNIRFFPTTLDPQPLKSEVYGMDRLRGWSTKDGFDEDGTDGVAGRPLINICSGNGFCEEDATCSCTLTDRGAHTNWTDVSGFRGDACEIECEGGAVDICSTHGVCNEVGSCTCHKGYRSIACNTSCLGLRDCDPAVGCGGVCNYAGACDDNGACTCEPAYRGDACEKICPPWDGILAHVCNGFGTCDDRGICLCDAFHEGEACSRIAGWVIFMAFIISLIFIVVSVHMIRRWLYNRMRQRRRARRDRRKVRRTQAAVSKLRSYQVPEPDAVALEAKGL